MDRIAIFIGIVAWIVGFFIGDGDLQKRHVRQENFHIECFISDKPINRLSKKKVYYWYKGGEVHSSMAGAEGFLLDDEFVKFYKNNQLFEKGEFKHGLKDGEWRSWHENGNLSSVSKYNLGYLTGKYKTFDEGGNIILDGRYRNNRKVGLWVDHSSNDSTYYKKGVGYKTKPKSFFTKIFEKIFKRKDSLSPKRKSIFRKRMKKDESKDSTTTDSVRSLKKREGFFKRLFRRKTSPDSLNI